MRDGKHNLTLVVMGGLSFPSEDECEVDEAIDDINRIAPDVVMVPGNLADSRLGFKAAAQRIKQLNAIVLPAMGHHDLQVEGCQTDEENIKLFVETFRMPGHYHDCEHAGILFITLSTERSRSHRGGPGGFFLSDKQLSWLEKTLENHPTTPTVVQCEAPVFGTHIPVIPNAHARATQAYANHYHRPERLLQIIQRHPQIILWFSGHSRLGHGYPNSICRHSGVHFVHVGVHSRQSTRDGLRHSRVVKIRPHQVSIRTFDHQERRVDPHYDYILNEGPYALACSWEVSTRTGFLSGQSSGFHISQTGLSLKPLPTNGYLSYLDQPASPSAQSIYPTDKKIYVATQGGYVWEYDRRSGLPLGTVYLDRQPKCVVSTRSHLWIGGGDGYIRKVPIDGQARFLHESTPDDMRHENIPLKGAIRAMWSLDGRLLAGADRRLYEIDAQTDRPVPKAVFKENILAIHSHRNRLYVLTGNDEISVFSFPDLQPLQTLSIPSREQAPQVSFFHVTDRFCFFAARRSGHITKVSLDDMKVVDGFRVPGKLQAVQFDSTEFFILTTRGRLLCIDAKGMTVKAQRDLEMQAASAMAIDNQYVYVASAEPGRRWQEVQIIERRTDMIGELSYHIRTAHKIVPQLEMDMEVSPDHLFIPQLHAKVHGDWVKFKNDVLPSQEFKVRIVLGNRTAADPPSISRIKLKDREDA